MGGKEGGTGKVLDTLVLGGELGNLKNFSHIVWLRNIFDALVIKAGDVVVTYGPHIPMSYNIKRLSFVPLSGNSGFAPCHLHFRIQSYEAISN